MSTPQQIGSITRNIQLLSGLLNNPPARDQIQAPTTPVFVHPILSQEDFKKTLENYNQHIKKFNIQVWMDNALVRKYNREVIRARKGACVPIEQKVKEQLWKEMNKDLSAEDYNQEVEEYNEKNGLQLRKKNLQEPVKPETEKYFLAFLYQYNAQLFRRKDYRIKLDVHAPGELPKFELYPNKIIEVERNGVKILPVSVETVRHHRERLEAAGVLLDYSFHGPNRAVKMRFNPGILSITDNGTPKNRLAENQAVTKEKTNKVPHNNVSSRDHVLKKNKIRDEGVAAIASTHFNCTGTSTETPKRQGGKNPVAPNNLPENYQKKSSPAPDLQSNQAKNEVSQVLGAAILGRTELARSLATGKFDTYRRIPVKIATQEAFRGALHQDDFKELAIQDIFKFSAHIFRDLDVHPGSWMNAYKIWLAEKFMSPNKYTLSKQNILSQWQRYIAILQEVKKFAKNHPTWQPHFPSLYFDPARKYKENNSFEYASQNFRMGDKEKDTSQERRVKAVKSLRHKTDVKKAQEKIREMITGKISLDRVYEYVQQNCEKPVQKNLHNLIKKEFEKHINHNE